MENMVINGNGSAPNASGYLDVITAPSNPTAVFTYANTKGLGASYVDGEWYGGMSNVNLVVRPEFVQVGEGLFSTSDDGTSLIDVLGRRVEVLLHPNICLWHPISHKVWPMVIPEVRQQCSQYGRVLDFQQWM